MMPQPPRLSWLPRTAPALFVGIILLTFAGCVLSAKVSLQAGGIALALLALVYLVATRPPHATLLSAAGLPAALVGGATLLTLISALWAVNPAAALSGAGRMVGIGLAGTLSIALAALIPPPSPRSLRLLLPLVSVALLAFAVMAAAHTPVQALIGEERIVYISVINKAIGSITFLIPVAIAVWATTGTATRWRNGLYVLLAAAFGAVAITSEAQSALLAGTVMLACLFLPVASARFWRALRVVIAGGVLLAPMLAITLFSFAADLHIDAIRRASIPQRLEVWHAIGQKIMEQPALGFGYNAARFIPHFDTAQMYQPGTTFSHPHNIALQFWLEFGALGAVLGAAALLLVLRRIERTPDLRIRRLYLATFASVFAVSLVGWGIWQSWWMTLVFLLAATNIAAARTITQSSR